MGLRRGRAAMDGEGRDKCECEKCRNAEQKRWAMRQAAMRLALLDALVLLLCCGLTALILRWMIRW